MHEAHARSQRYEHDQAETPPDRPALHAVPSEQARAALRDLERSLAGDAGAPREARTRTRERVSVDELELQFDDMMAAPRHRPARPARPTGAAADYARGERRTVQIRGQVAPASSLRPTPSELRGPRPDRVAAWAFAFALFLAVLALVTG